MKRISIILLSFGIIVFLLGACATYIETYALYRTPLLGNLIYLIPGILIITLSLLVKREKNQKSALVAIALGIFTGIIAYTVVISPLFPCESTSAQIAPVVVTLIMVYFATLIINNWKIRPFALYFGLAVFFFIITFFALTSISFGEGGGCSI